MTGTIRPLDSSSSPASPTASKKEIFTPYMSQPDFHPLRTLYWNEDIFILLLLYQSQHLNESDSLYHLMTVLYQSDTSVSVLSFESTSSNPFVSAQSKPKHLNQSNEIFFQSKHLCQSLHPSF